MTPTVAVVGGGIAGLAAALEIVEAGGRCHLFEAELRLGGKIHTSRSGDLVVEAGADSILSAKPAGLDLIRRLGLSGRVIDTSAADRGTFVYSRGRLRALPEGLVLGSPARAGGLLRSGLVSPAGALRMASELAVRPRRYAVGGRGVGGRGVGGRGGGGPGVGGPGVEESIAAFFTRRLGREAFERVVEPLLAGIHAGDAARLSLDATFPRFVDMERRHGGLVRAALARQGGEPPATGHTPFISLAGGTGELVEALAGRLAAAGASITTGTPVDEVVPLPDGRWRLSVAGATEALEADAVILATPAPVTARLLRRLAPPAAALLDAVPHTSTATVSLAYRRSDLVGTPRGFGFVVPRVEGRPLIAATWSTNKWAQRAPAGIVLARGYLGGAGREETLAGADDTLVATVRSELGQLAGVTGSPVHAEVHRFPAGMPQYTLGHGDRVARMREHLENRPGLAVAGATYGGVGIPDCIADGAGTARKLMKELQNRESASKA